MAGPLLVSMRFTVGTDTFEFFRQLRLCHPDQGAAAICLPVGLSIGINIPVGPLMS